MLPGDRLVCVLVDPIDLGTTFRAWPLHVTVVPWFRAAMSNEEVLTGIGGVVRSFEPFNIAIDGEGHFGHRGSKLVNLVRLPTLLTRIERQVRCFLKEHDAWIVDETTKRIRPFKPHVTVQGGKRLTSGDSFTCRGLYLIEQQGGVKQVVGLVEFAP